MLSFYLRKIVYNVEKGKKHSPYLHYIREIKRDETKIYRVIIQYLYGIISTLYVMSTGDILLAMTVYRKYLKTVTIFNSCLVQHVLGQA